MKIPIKNIDSFQQQLQNIYAGCNAARPWDYEYGYLTRRVGVLFRNIRNGSSSEQNIIKVYAWLFAIANKLEINIFDAFIKKTPGKCHYCLSAPCRCEMTGKQPYNSKFSNPFAAHQERINAYDSYKTIIKDRSFAEVISILEAAYPHNRVLWRYAGPYFVFSKVLEEMAELHEAICDHEMKGGSISNVENEIADVFSWITVVAYLYRSTPTTWEFEMSKMFDNGCPECGNIHCACPPRMGKFEAKVDPQYLKNLINLFDELDKNVSEEFKDDIGTAKKAVQLAITNGDDATVIQAVACVDKTANKIKDAYSAEKAVKNLKDASAGILALLTNVTKSAAIIGKLFS